MASQIIGGVGLFLLGMWLMTEGLKTAAGSALKSILERWTSTPLRGLVTGFGLTALVQASGAVTVATIGFANAGLMTLSHAVWVIYGTNLGTTMTAWLVTLFGFKLDIGAWALPLVGIGMAIRMTAGRSRRAGFGLALAGFGLLFLGISGLKDGFESLAGQIALPEGIAASPWARLAYVGVGFAMTVLMQSSSAATVVALSAVASSLITPEQAAAVVIGANLGTTVTGLVAVWGATPTAKRVAVSHLAFNLLTAIVALAILPQLMAAITGLRAAFGFEPSPAVDLSLFHTAFNVLGVLLIWPLTPALVRFLDGRFRGQDKIVSNLQHLDSTVLAVPSLAIEAARKETARLRDLGERSILDWLDSPEDDTRLVRATEQVRQLSTGISDFLTRLTASTLTPEEAGQVATLMRVLQHYVAAMEDAGVARDMLVAPRQVPPDRIALQHEVRDVISEPARMSQETEDMLRERREAIKEHLLIIVAGRGISLDSFDYALRGMNAELRMLRHLRKGRDHIADLQASNPSEWAREPAGGEEAHDELAGDATLRA